MNRKVTAIIIGVIVVAALALGIYAASHKSPYANSTSNSQTYAKSNNPSSSTTSTTPVNNSVVITKTSSSVGQYLADPSGKTLYTFNKDTTDKSNCTGSCIAAWPAYAANSTSNLPANIGVITRSDDGKKQYTYKGMPLYFFVDDTAAGQISGNGVQGFSVAKP